MIILECCDGCKSLKDEVKRLKSMVVNMLLSKVNWDDVKRIVDERERKKNEGLLKV